MRKLQFQNYFGGDKTFFIFQRSLQNLNYSSKFSIQGLLLFNIILILNEKLHLNETSVIALKWIQQSNVKIRLYKDAILKKSFIGNLFVCNSTFMLTFCFVSFCFISTLEPLNVLSNVFEFIEAFQQSEVVFQHFLSRWSSEIYLAHGCELLFGLLLLSPDHGYYHNDSEIQSLKPLRIGMSVFTPPLDLFKCLHDYITRFLVSCSYLPFFCES